MKKLSIFLIILFMSLIVNVNAKSVAINTDKYDLNIGDEIVVSIDLEDYDLIDSYDAKFSFDRDVFELLSNDNFVTNKNFSNVSYNSSSNRYSINNTLGDNNTLQIKLKVKDDALKGVTTIFINDINGKTLKSEYDYEDNSVDVNIVNGTTKEVVSNSEEDEVEEEKMSWINVILILISAGICLFVINYYIRTREEEESPNYIVLAVSILAMIGFFLGGIFINIDKNKLNGTFVDFENARKLMEYNITVIKEQEEDNSEDVSLNVLDESKISSNLEEAIALNYQVNIKEGKFDNYYPEKGDTVKLELNLDTNYDSDIKAVKIDGILYDAYKIDENKYFINFLTPKKYGKQKVVITDIILDNNKEITSNYEVEFVVLKDKPNISDLQIDNKEEIPLITFKLNDEDKSFISGKIVILDSSNKEVITSPLKVGKIALNQELISGEKYNIKIIVKYDLDLEDNNLNEYEEIIYDKTFTFERDYNFIAKNIKITEIVKNTDDLVLTLENAYNSYFDVKEVVVSSKTYPVSKKGNLYTVILPKDKRGKNEIVLNEVILENNAKYQVNQKLSYIYLKDEPVITTLKTTYDKPKLSFNYEILDNNQSVKEVIVTLLKDLEEKTKLSYKDLSKEDEFLLEEAGDYQIKLEVIYDLGDGKEKVITKVLDDIYTVDETTQIISHKVGYYVKKNEDFNIIYNVLDNTDKDVKKLVINGSEKEVVKLSSDKYMVTITSIDDNQIMPLVVTRIIYDDESILTNYDKSEVYVLKDIPSISNLNVDTKEEKPKVSFTITDSDGSYKSGILKVTGEDGREEEILFTNEREITLENIQEFKLYTVEVLASYDLDDDSNNDLNNETLKSNKVSFEVKKNYDFKLSDLTVKEVNQENIVLTFTSSNASNKYYVKSVVINGESYDVKEREGNTYTVNIPNTYKEPLSLVTLTLTEATLDDEEVFDGLGESVTIFKDAPTATISDLNLDSDKKKISANISISDNHETIKDEKVYATLIGPNNYRETKEVSIIDNAGSVFFDSSEIFMAGTYTLDVLASYDLVDGNTHYNIVISNDDNTVDVPIVANISNSEVPNYYNERGKSFNVNFVITSNTLEEITSIEVNNNPKTFTKLDNNKYQVVLSEESFGEKTYQITKIKYGDTEITFDNSSEAKAYILKLVPSFTVTYEDIENPRVKVLVSDDEDTIKDGAKVVIKSSMGSVIEEKSLDEVKNSNFNLTKELYANGTYYVTLEGTYDLVEGKSLDYQKDLSDLLNEEINVITDYQLEITDLHVTGIEKENTKIKLVFNSTNYSEKKLSQIRIGGLYYDVTYDGVSYTAYVPYVGEIKQTIEVEGAKLETGKELTLSEKASIEIFKNAPTATIDSTLLDETNKKITVKFTVEDLDKTITDGKVVVSVSNTENDEVITKDVLINSDGSYEVSLTNDEVFMAGLNTVTIKANFDRADGETHQSEKISSDSNNTVNVPIVSEVLSSKINKLYPTKGEDVEVTYTFKHNVSKTKVTKIKLKENSDITKDYEVEEITDNSYKITYKAPIVHGIVKLKVTEVSYGDTVISNIVSPDQDQIDVLKTTPSMTNVKTIVHMVQETIDGKVYPANTITFKFNLNDPDNAGLKDENGNLIINYELPTYTLIKNISSEKLQLGENELTFGNSPKSNQILMFGIIFSYDLDSDLNNGLNENMGRTLGRYGAWIPSFANLHLNNLKILHEVDGSWVETTNLKKNEAFKVSFEANPLSEDGQSYSIIKATINKVEYELENEGNVYTTSNTLTGFSENSDVLLEKIVIKNNQNSEETLDLNEQKITVSVVS